MDKDGKIKRLRVERKIWRGKCKKDEVLEEKDEGGALGDVWFSLEKLDVFNFIFIFILVDRGRERDVERMLAMRNRGRWWREIVFMARFG